MKRDWGQGRFLWRCSLLPLALLGLQTARADNPSFEERVAAQRAIADVFWRHRIWPAENPRPKPSLEAVMPEAAIRAKVEDYLRKSKALETFWQRPITAEQLQAEMERTAERSRDPAMLRELFAVLHHDPFLIAEALARQTLADRLIKGWYAWDERFHGEMRRVAERELSGVTHAGALAALQADTVQTTYRLRTAPHPEQGTTGEIELDEQGWHTTLRRLAGVFGTDDPDPAATRLDRLPLMQVSALEEDEEGFHVTSVLAKGSNFVTTVTVSWPKTPFETWWARAGAQFVVEQDSGVPHGYVLPTERSGFPCSQLDSWTPTPGPPDPREYHTAIWTGSEMIVWGSSSVTGGRYIPATDTWIPTSTIGAPEERWQHTAVWTGSEMLVWGGSYGNTTYFGDGGRYDPATDSWSPISGTGAPAGRSRHTAVWTGSEMLVWGGSQGTTTYFGDGGRYDPATDVWTPIATTGAPSARNPNAVWTGNEMIVWGGYGGAYLNTGGRYAPSTNTWVTSSTVGAPVARGLHSAVWTGSEMIVWGGSTPGNSAVNTGGRYDPQSDSWVATSTSGAPSGRRLHTAVWTGDEMIVWGGGGPITQTGGRYVPALDAWVATPLSGAPPPRDNHTAVWTGSEMIVWGGEGSNFGALATGGRYAPATNSWVPTLTAADARTLQASVWTGSEMIVWGGYGLLPGQQYGMAAGAKYTPVSDTWSSIADAGLPGRGNLTAVWTGSEMIVWGGRTSGPGQYHNTGGRYNPASDAWVATASAHAPPARESQTAVWTGSEMIVWGGSNGVFLNTGGRYDPSTNAWNVTSTVGAPSPRREHTAVWTGSAMIVWGGESAVWQNTGARYMPDTDSWVAASTVGAPAGRGAHSALWTGDAMIVWGGSNSSSTGLATGGSYEPVSDTWQATSMEGAPVPSRSHAAVWTGDEMIVWGGSATMGGRYRPATDAWAPLSNTGAPLARLHPSSAWTGHEMIVWGGAYFSSVGLLSGGLYCGCLAGATAFLDADGDGWGDPASGTLVTECAPPPGNVGNSLDCDDVHPSVQPGAPEVCDGLRNDCLAADWPALDDQDGDGVEQACDNCPQAWNPDQGPAAFGQVVLAQDPTHFGWEDPADMIYLRGQLSQLDTYGFEFLSSSFGLALGFEDPLPPPPAAGFYYLVRPLCDVGSWQSSLGVEGERDAVLP